MLDQRSKLRWPLRWNAITFSQPLKSARKLRGKNFFRQWHKKLRRKEWKELKWKSRMARRLICHLNAKSLLKVRGKGNSNGDARGCFHFCLRPCSVYFLISVPLAYPLNWQFRRGQRTSENDLRNKRKKWIKMNEQLNEYSYTDVRRYTITRIRMWDKIYDYSCTNNWTMNERI